MSLLHEHWQATRRILIVLGLALSVAACNGAAAARFTIDQPPGPYFGRTYAEWGTEWWKWLWETPAMNHPILDTTGANCAVGQPTSGPFYLVGSFGSTETRNCTAPAGRPFFFPIGNFSGDNCGVDPAMQLTEAQLMDGVNTGINFEGMSLTIDGTIVGDTPEELAAYRTPATRYSYTVPATGSLYAQFGLNFTGLCDPSFAGGYWVMLEPLPAGAHTIHFTVHNDPSTPGGSDAYDLDVTYNLTIR